MSREASDTGVVKTLRRDLDILIQDFTFLTQQFHFLNEKVFKEHVNMESDMDQTKAVVFKNFTKIGNIERWQSDAHQRIRSLENEIQQLRQKLNNTQSR